MERVCYLDDVITRDLAKKMVFVGGPRQVGKTTLAKQQIARIQASAQKGRYFNWDFDEDRQAPLAKDVPRWLDLGGDLKAKREVKYGYTTTTGACGRVEVTLTSTGKDIMYSLVQQGAAKEVPAVEVNFEGKWSASCGIGKQTLKAVYSPALDLLLAYETMNYLPNGFLYVGSAWSLKSLN